MQSECIIRLQHEKEKIYGTVLTPEKLSESDLGNIDISSARSAYPVYIDSFPQNIRLVMGILRKKH